MTILNSIPPRPRRPRRLPADASGPVESALAGQPEPRPCAVDENVDRAAEGHLRFSHEAFSLLWNRHLAPDGRDLGGGRIEAPGYAFGRLGVGGGRARRARQGNFGLGHLGFPTNGGRADGIICGPPRTLRG